MTDFGRQHDSVGEQGVDGRQTGAGSEPPGVNLNWRRLACERAQTIAGGVARQIEQDVDLVGANPVRKLAVRKMQYVASVIRNCTKRAGELVLTLDAGIADHLELAFVVALQHWPDGERRRTEIEVGRNIAENDAAVRVAIVVVMLRGTRKDRLPDTAPPVGARLLLPRVVGI